MKMRALKRTIAIFTTLMLMCWVTSLYSVVFAVESEFDHTQKGSITIDYQHDDTPINDVRFKVYQITAMDKNQKQQFTPQFEGIFDVDFVALQEQEAWHYFRDNLENYINFEGVQPQKTFATEVNGDYILDGLQLGIYFIQSEMVISGVNQLYSEPILIQVGHYGDIEEKWIYNYTIEPKISTMGREPHDLSVQKLWKKTNSDLLIPEEIEIELRADGETYEVVKLNKDNAWSYTWKNIDPTKFWAVKELTEFEDFEVNYHKQLFEISIENTYTGEPDEELPQTGSIAYLIPICSGAGILFLLIGLLLKQDFKRKKDDILGDSDK